MLTLCSFQTRQKELQSLVIINTTSSFGSYHCQQLRPSWELWSTYNSTESAPTKQDVHLSYTNKFINIQFLMYKITNLKQFWSC